MSLDTAWLILIGDIVFLVGVLVGLVIASYRFFPRELRADDPPAKSSTEDPTGNQERTFREDS